VISPKKFILVSLGETWAGIKSKKTSLYGKQKGPKGKKISKLKKTVLNLSGDLRTTGILNYPSIKLGKTGQKNGILGIHFPL